MKIYNTNKDVYVFIKNNKLFYVRSFYYFIYDLDIKNTNYNLITFNNEYYLAVHQIDYNDDPSRYKFNPSELYCKIKDNYNLNLSNTGVYKFYSKQIEELDIEIMSSIRDEKLNRLLDERI